LQLRLGRILAKRAHNGAQLLGCDLSYTPLASLQSGLPCIVR
jgi:hypothetical protein